MERIEIIIPSDKQSTHIFKAIGYVIMTFILLFLEHNVQYLLVFLTVHQWWISLPVRKMDANLLFSTFLWLKKVIFHRDLGRSAKRTRKVCIRDLGRSTSRPRKVSKENFVGLQRKGGRIPKRTGKLLFLSLVFCWNGIFSIEHKVFVLILFYIYSFPMEVGQKIVLLYRCNFDHFSFVLY